MKIQRLRIPCLLSASGFFSIECGFAVPICLAYRFIGCWYFLGFLVCICVLSDAAGAATLQLSWIDNSNNEDGFNIERKVAVAGTYARIATIGTNVTAYADFNLSDGIAYCYRVNAFNSGGISSYTAEVCSTAQDAQSVDLTIPTDGGSSVGLTMPTQDGSLATSAGVTITCGTACAVGSNAGTSPVSDPLSKSRIKKRRTTNPTLTIQIISTISTGSGGAGKVISRPNAINCGSKCSASFQSNVIVALRAIPTKGSIFTGWSGDNECADGSVAMTRDISCSATFQLLTHTLSITLIGNGTGKVISDLSGIDCGTSCVARFTKGAKVKLTAIPAPDSLFSGWSVDGDCRNGTLSIKTEKSCAAVFTKRIPSKIGIYRPSSGEWYLTGTITKVWYGCDVDGCMESSGDSGNLPITGDWDGAGKSKLGIYDSERKTWKLNIQAPEIFQDCGLGVCMQFTIPRSSGGTQVPVTGRWNTSAKDSIGIYQLVPDQSEAKFVRRSSRSETVRIQGSKAEHHVGYWYLDLNGNGTWDGCIIDTCLGPFGGAGDIPIVGDWSGDGISKIGIYDPLRGMWQLDYNGDGKVDDCTIDQCLGRFGFAGDLPVVGDWDGSGTSKIGVFRPMTGEWFLDINGNGQWDGCNIDNCLSGFGQEGDLPIAGKW